MTNTESENSGASNMNALEDRVRRLLEKKDQLNQLLVTTEGQWTQVEGEMKAALRELREEYDRIGLEISAKRAPFDATLDKLDIVAAETKNRIAEVSEEIDRLNAELVLVQIQCGRRGIETRADVKVLLMSIGVHFTGRTNGPTVDHRVRTLANGVRVFRVTSGFHDQEVVSLAVKGNQVVGIQKTSRSMHPGDSAIYKAWINGPTLSPTNELLWGRRDAEARYGLDPPHYMHHRNYGFSFKEWLTVLKGMTTFEPFNLSDVNVAGTIVGWLN